MTWQPSPAEERDYDVSAEWIRTQSEGSVGARVCCPRGHLISHVGLFVNSAGIMTQPRLREHKSGYFSDGASPNDRYLKVRLICQHRGCGYRGTFLQARLALEVARHVRRGDREMRLTD